MIKPGHEDFYEILIRNGLFSGHHSTRPDSMEDLLHFLFALLAIFAPLLLVAWLLFRRDRKN